VLERISDPVSGDPVSRLRRVDASWAGVWRLCIDRSPSTVSSSLCSKGMSCGDVGISEYLDARDWSMESSSSSSSSAEFLTTAAGIVTSSISRPRKITTSSSPGSLLYTGSEVTDICDGVRRGLRVRRAVRGAPASLPASSVAVTSRRPPLLIVPASCSAVNSRVRPPAPPPNGDAAAAPEKLNREGVLRFQVMTATILRMTMANAMGTQTLGDMLEFCVSSRRSRTFARPNGVAPAPP
jgi:hypothetical protein